MANKLVCTKDMPRDEWLEWRRKSIGGSDAAAIVGMNPYVTPYMLWADKSRRLPDMPDTEAMRQGRDLEQYVAERFMDETGKKVRRSNYMYQHDDYDFIAANIDREVVGERAGLECKTTSVMNLKKFRNGEYPENYYVQCVHYLAVTGWDRWYLAVLILNQGFMWFTIERDQSEINALMQAEQDFWKTYVVPDISPPVDGLQPTSNALTGVYSQSDCKTIALFGHEDTARAYLALSEQINTLKREQGRLAQILKSDMREAESGVCGPYTVTWKNTEKASVSRELLRKRYPKINLSKVMRVSKSRRFSVKEDAR